MGSVLVVFSYFIVVHVNVILGTMLHAVACGLSIPFFLKIRAWDVVSMLTFMTIISISKFT